ncbi:MAG: hypothetical protein UY65_C0016G0003 [Parcubacteria group bacterium GW2011_GWA2_51_12]|nr:MAG: hypothetical protein UY65_C0016G0003 [Parcubacteria group bacterium GW2011_GWA2_51_12]
MARKDEFQNGAPETIVGATVKIEGDLVSEGDIRVDGLVAGKIKTSKNLFVGPMAKIEADVEAQNAVLSGIVKGDIKVRDSMVVQETAKIEGNITCSRLSIAEGAHFTGSCTMPEKEGNLKQPLPEDEE